MWRIPECESTWRWWARNPTAVGVEHATGLYQFLPSTWASTPYGRHWIYSSRWQAMAAGYMVLAGRSGEWECR